MLQKTTPSCTCRNLRIHASNTCMYVIHKSYVFMHAFGYKYVLIYASIFYTCAHTGTLIYVYMYHLHPCIYRYTLTCILTDYTVHSHLYMYIYTLIRMQKHVNTYTYTWTYAYKNTYTLIIIHTYIHSYKQASAFYSPLPVTRSCVHVLHQPKSGICAGMSLVFPACAIYEVDVTEMINKVENASASGMFLCVLTFCVGTHTWICVYIAIYIYIYIYIYIL